jgi:HAD superfamily hydrolase (TIGR01450 family)
MIARETTGTEMSTSTFPRETTVDLTLVERIAAVRGVMFDIDGCLLLADQPSGYGGTVLPGAERVLDTVRATGRSFVCFTNGSFQTPSAIATTLRNLGLYVTDEQVMTPAVVAAETMATRYPGGRVLVFGGEGVTEPFTARGVDMVDIDEAIAGRAGDVAAVVVGWDTEFGRSKIVAAAEAVLAGAKLYTTSAAPTFASHERLNVGVSGFIAAGLTHVTGRDYKVLGKPSAEAFNAICSRTGARPEQVLVAGDDLRMEASMARQNGAVGVLMTTGTNSREDARNATADRIPDLVLDSLDELSDLLQAHTIPEDAPSTSTGTEAP